MLRNNKNKKKRRKFYDLRFKKDLKLWKNNSKNELKELKSLIQRLGKSNKSNDYTRNLK